MKSFKLITLIIMALVLLSGFAYLLTVNTVSPVGETPAITATQAKSKTVAIMTAASYIDPNASYPTYLYYKAYLSVKDALDYLGVPNEFVADSVSLDTLSQYGGLIVIRGGTDAWNLASAWATSGKTVMYLMVGGGDPAWTTGLGITDSGKAASGEVVGTLVNGDAITAGLMDSYGTIGTFNTNSITLNSNGFDQTILIDHNSDTSQPFLIKTVRNAGGTFYTYLTTASYPNGIYYNQMLMNYVSIAIPNYTRWMPFPNGASSGFVIRFDDAKNLDPKFLQFWKRYPVSTSSVQANMTAELAAYLKEGNVADYMPHGYDHETFNDSISFTKAMTLLENITTSWKANFGTTWDAMVMPENTASVNITYAMATTGHQIMFEAAGHGVSPRHYYVTDYATAAYSWGPYYTTGGIYNYVNQTIAQNRVGSSMYHPYKMDSIGISKAMAEIDTILSIVNSSHTCALTTYGELVKIYLSHKTTTINSTQMEFGRDVPEGLTLEIKNYPAGHTLKVDGITLEREGDRFIFPAINAGIYNYEDVEIESTSSHTTSIVKDSAYSYSLISNIDETLAVTDVTYWSYRNSTALKIFYSLCHLEMVI